jgi:hypothetical protein
MIQMMGTNTTSILSHSNRPSSLTQGVSALTIVCKPAFLFLPLVMRNQTAGMLMYRMHNDVTMHDGTINNSYKTVSLWRCRAVIPRCYPVIILIIFKMAHLDIAAADCSGCRSTDGALSLVSRCGHLCSARWAVSEAFCCLCSK